MSKIAGNDGRDVVIWCDIVRPSVLVFLKVVIYASLITAHHPFCRKQRARASNLCNSKTCLCRHQVTELLITVERATGRIHKRL